MGDLALEMCDPEGVLPCEHLAAILAEPVAGSGVSLIYSSEWSAARLDRPEAWSAAPLGLGGWSLDVLQRYDPENGVLLGGDGSWRVAAAVDVGGGEKAVPTYDGFRYFVFDSDWRHVRTVDTITGTTLLTLSYDAAGRLSNVTGNTADGPVALTVQRDAEGNVTALEGVESLATTIGMDADGNLGIVLRPNGSATTLSATEFGLVTEYHTSGRGTVAYEYDDAGRLASMTDGDGVSVAFAFQGGEGSASVSTTYATTGSSRVVSARDGDVVRRTWTDADGTTTVLDTNADGSTSLTEPDGTVTTAGATPHQVWGASAPIRSPYVETRPDGTEYRVEVTSTMGAGSPQPAGQSWQTETTVNAVSYTDSYDSGTRTLTRTDAAGRQTRRVFDELGRIVEIAQPGRPVARYTFDAEGRIATQSVGSAITTYAYDPQSGLVTVTRPDGSSVAQAYNAFALSMRAATPDENVSYVRDAAGSVIQVRPGARPASSIGYSDAGRETAYIPPALGDDSGYEITTYNDAGQISSINGPGERAIEITYDAAGRASGWSFGEGSATSEYDPASGLLDRTVTADGVTTDFSYSGWVPTGFTWSGRVSGSVDLTIDGQLRMTSQTINGADSVAYTYGADGLLSGIDALEIERDATTGLPASASLGDVEVRSSYDADGRVTAAAATAGGATVAELTYTYDALGRVASVAARLGSDETTTAYTYDDSGRLASVNRDGVTETYSYDETGNRTGVSYSDGRSGVEATFDDRDRILTAGDAIYEFAGDGSLLSRESPDGTTAYEFDDFGALRSLTTVGGNEISYVLDAGGRRIGRTVDGELTDGYLYSTDDTIVAWLNGSGEVVARFFYDDSGRLALVKRDGRDLVVLTDRLGSPMALIDAATGELAETNAFDAWGNPLDTGAKAGAALTPFGFAGGLTDAESGFVHFGARDYEPATGRWTSADPLRYAAADLNLYRYALGDPVNYVDPSGYKGFGGGARRGGTTGGGAVGGGRSGGGKSGGGKTGGGSNTGAGNNGLPKGYRDNGPLGGITGPDGKQVPYYNEPNPDRSNYDGYPRRGRPTSPPPNTICVGLYCQDVNDPDNGSTSPVLPGGNCYGGCVGVPFGGGGVCVGACVINGPDGSKGTCLIGCVFGEPHLLTSDGVHINFQAAGEFLLERSSDGTFEMQGRFQPPGARTDVTLATALAINVGGDRVGFYSDSARPMVVNGEIIERAEYATTLPNGGKLERHGSWATVTGADGTAVQVHLYGRFLNFAVTPSDAIAADMTGLFGDHDGDQENDLTTRDGVVIDPETADFAERLYGEFATSWRITDEQSLFDYLDTESTATFTRPEIPTQPASLDSLDEQTRNDAQALCVAAGATTEPFLSDCILDVGLTGDPEYASSAASVEAAAERASTTVAPTGRAIELDQQVDGQLAAGSVDRYSFTVEAGAIVYLDAADACDTALDWRLLAPNGALTAFEPACVDMARRVLVDEGAWTIEMYSDESAAGAYSFTVLSVPQPTEERVERGLPVSGATTAVGERHRYQLSAAAGDIVYLDAQGDCASPMSWQLLSPDGTLVTFEKACIDMGRRVLDVEGDWVVEIYDLEKSTGSYQFTVLDVPAPQVNPLSIGATVTDATSAVGERHRYELSAAAGDIIYLDALGDCVPGLYWQLLGPDGGLRTFERTCADMRRRVLDVAGTWVVEVYADDMSTGSYSFTVIAVPPDEESAVSLGQVLSGNIGSVGEQHRYMLAAQQGQQIVIDGQGECVPDLWWRLLGPEGSLRTFGATCNDSAPLTLDVGGDWTVEVYSETTATGSYQIQINQAP